MMFIQSGYLFLKNSPKSAWIFICLTVLLFCWAVSLKNQIELYGDIAYLLVTTKSIMLGKHYGIDFFETNPPMESQFTNIKYRRD